MEPHDLRALVHQLSQVEMASPPGAETSKPAFASTPFAKLASFNHGGVFLGRFSGRTPWERHSHGDELVQVLEGEVDLTIMTARKPVHTYRHVVRGRPAV
jgi:quercetin dioxygenase-like cupin family protein